MTLACGSGGRPADDPASKAGQSNPGQHTDDCSWYDTAVEAEAWDETTRAHLRAVCEVEAEFARFVGERQQCSADADCAVVPTSCPLGCGVVVAVGSDSAVRGKHDELRARLADGDSECSDACEPPERPACEDGRCAPGG